MMMLSDRLVAALRSRNIYYGWVVAGTTFLVMLATAGAMGSAGVLIDPLQQEFGWSTEQISTAFAIRLVFFGLLGPFAAAFMNHFGIRKVVLAATVASRWFEKRRGLVVGLMTASNATGQLIFLPLLASLSEHIGWRAA